MSRRPKKANSLTKYYPEFPDLQWESRQNGAGKIVLRIAFIIQAPPCPQAKSEALAATLGLRWIGTPGYPRDAACGAVPAKLHILQTRNDAGKHPVCVLLSTPSHSIHGDASAVSISPCSYADFLRLPRRSYATLTCKMPDNLQSTPGVTGLETSSSAPQFATAEYAHIPGTERCRICGNLVTGEYFRVNNQMACGNCAMQAKAGQPADSHAAFVRALLLGSGAALLGLILYATFTIITGLYVGYIALGVGWLVATAMMKASNGMGGRRYQITAVLLTYAAISLAAIPISIGYSIKHRSNASNRAATTAQSSNDNSADEDADAQPNAQPASGPAARPSVNLGKMLVQLVFIGLASPFLELRDPIHGLIGLVILLVGLRIAFRLTAAKPLEVDGPYAVNG